MTSLIILIVIVIIFFFCIKFKIIDRRILFEGLIIGTVSGIFISLATDVNYRASLTGPFIELGKKFNNNFRYASKNWGSIKATQVGQGMVDVSATNIVTGSIVTFTNTPISRLPSDLRYAVATGDVASNKTIVNIFAPKVDARYVAGGSVLEIRPKEEKK